MLLADIRDALRLFRREPGFVTAAVLTLTLGIGVNTALFAIVEAALLRPLPLSGADDLVVVWHRDVSTGIAKSDIAIGDFVDLRARQRSLESLAGFGGFQGTLIASGDPVQVQGTTATPDLFEALRMQPALGRVLRGEDTRDGAAPVVIVSYELWRRELGSDPDITSRSLELGSVRRMVVGVAPPGFEFPPGRRTDVIVPQTLPATAPPARKSGWMYGIGRLRAGVTAAQAEAEFAALSRQLELEFSQQNQGSLYYTRSLRDALLGDTKRPLLLLLASVGLVLLIACANVGNLVLARLLSRKQELTTRLALGARHRQLITKIVIEATVLSLVGGLAGIAVAWSAVPAIASMLPEAAQGPGLDRVGINAAVLLFSLAASVAAAMIFSAVACAGLTREGAWTPIGGDRRMTMSGNVKAAGSSLVAVEIALAVVLLIAAGLTLRSFANLVAVDTGFTPSGVLTVQVGLPLDRYADEAARRAFYLRAFAALENLAAVDTVGAAMVTPLTGNNWSVPLQRPEHPLPRGQRPPDVGWQAASGGYFRALRIPLLAGRLFDARDTPQSPPVVIVSQALARQYFAGETAVGKRIRLGDAEMEIVGVVGDIRRAALADPPRPDMYFPFERLPGGSITLFIRTNADPLAALPAVRTTIRDLEPKAVLYGSRTMADIAAGSAAVARLAMRVLGGFAAVALALAAVGVYGVMSYHVRRRTRELGVRMALGASRGNILRLVMAHASVTIAIGLGVGVAGGLAAARALSAILYGVPPWDPLALAAAATLLTAVALGASYIPARRASRVDPVSVMAAE